MLGEIEPCSGKPDPLLSYRDWLASRPREERRFGNMNKVVPKRGEVSMVF